MAKKKWTNAEIKDIAGVLCSMAGVQKRFGTGVDFLVGALEEMEARSLSNGDELLKFMLANHNTNSFADRMGKSDIKKIIKKRAKEK